MTYRENLRKDIISEGSSRPLDKEQVAALASELEALRGALAPHLPSLAMEDEPSYFVRALERNRP